MVSLCVKSSVFGDGQSCADLPEVTLRLVSERVSLEELIARAVREQIEALRDRYSGEADRITGQLRRQYLAAGDVAAGAQSGKVALATGRPDDPGEIDIDAEAALAVEAFRRGKFRVFVDSEPVTSLTDVFTVTDTTKVIFLRLVPLIGG